MNKLSILCAAATLGAPMFISTEASARGGHHAAGTMAGGTMAGWLASRGVAGRWLASRRVARREAITMAAGTAAVTAMGVGADGSLLVNPGMARALSDSMESEGALYLCFVAFSWTRTGIHFA